MEGENDRVILEDPILDVGDCNEDVALENEKCGICMDLIIDRGVLDCCNHWFCFACIDNWAIITNLCPLCKNEFQMITCLPVYDTIGNNNATDDSLSRDDDWSIQGKNSTLSFPSYYIDEDAVVCLDGDDCRIRNGLSTSGEDLPLDTSIACDSCDIWYHAFCVGFDPENTSDNSWLCPRCAIDEVPQKSTPLLVQSASELSGQENCDLECSFEAAFSGKVSVTVADAGETAVVVSMVGGEQKNEKLESFLDDIRLDIGNDRKITTSFSNFDAHTPNLEMEKTVLQPNADSQENSLILSLFQDTSRLSSADHFHEDLSVSSGLDGFHASSASLFDTFQTTSKLSGSEAGINLQLGLSVGSSMFADSMGANANAYQAVGHTHEKSSSGESYLSDLVKTNNAKENQAIGDTHQKSVSDGSSLSADLVDTNANGNQTIGEAHQKSISDRSSLSADLVGTNTTSNEDGDIYMKNSGSSLSADLVGTNATSNEDGDIYMKNSGSSLSADLVGTNATSNEDGDIYMKNSGSSLSDDLVGTSASGKQVVGDAQHKSYSDESSLSVDKVSSDANENVIGITYQKNLEVSGAKRKYIGKFRDENHMEREQDIKIESELPSKKSRSDGKFPIIPLRRQVKNFGSEINSRNIPTKKNATPDIMSIVQETDRKSSRGVLSPLSTDEPIVENDNSNRLRVKKIMRRGADDKESSSLLQKLRQEIREAVRNKASVDHCKNDIFDAKLLTAFRTAIAGPTREPAKKVNPSLVRTKKLMLQKGKIRENLTKKIYGSTSGRRRRAWDRDWEIEFWKHRCTRTDPSKIETLKSVLDLLRRSSDSESSEMVKGTQGEGKNSILSRLYLADTSVFPRKEDIKPMSVLIGDVERNKDDTTMCTSKNVPKPVQDNVNNKMSVGSMNLSQNRVPYSNNIVKKSHILNSKGDTANLKTHPNKVVGRLSSVSISSGSKRHEGPLKENPGRFEDVKSDKRKWAMEVLARKNGIMNKDENQGKHEDTFMLKGNYPLLAQLPADMRPVLAPICHSKVPLSVRQAQLFRLTEQHLRNVNLPIIRRTAETELAVADAVNIEKDICERSNSKLVYVNLCSQVLSQRKNYIESTTEAKEAKEDEFFDAGTTCENVEAALRLAGLVSDSPPNSPKLGEDLQEKDSILMNCNEGDLENVFDLDSHSELDIYGDFDYDLDDEDCTIPSGLTIVSKASPLQLEGEMKMKVVLSSSTLERTSDLGIFKLPSSENDSLVKIDSIPKDREKESSDLEAKTTESRPIVQQDEELSLVECEELYGPDKEPLINRVDFNGIEKVENLLPCRKESHDYKSNSCTDNNLVRDNLNVKHECSEENSVAHSLMIDNVERKNKKVSNAKPLDLSHSIYKKVEVYIKEHIRPLCKSGVITVEQYRWAVSRTAEKVMKFHCKAKNAHFLIKEGDKVKKLAQQYVEAAQMKK